MIPSFKSNDKKIELNSLDTVAVVKDLLIDDAIGNNGKQYDPWGTDISAKVLGDSQTVRSDTRSDRLFDVLPRNAVVAEGLIANGGFDKPLERRFDWFTFVGDNVSEDDFADVVNKIIIGEFWGIESEVSSQYYDADIKLYRGGKAYTQLWESDIGIRLVSDIVEKDNDKKIKCILSISGSVLASLYPPNGIRNPLSLVKYMYRAGFHVSRCDLAVSTYDLTLLPNIRQAMVQGNFAGFRGSKEGTDYFESWGFIPKSESKCYRICEKLGILPVDNEDKIYALKGATQYLGSRESDEFTRIYYENELHNNRAIRWEKELKKEKARKAIQLLLEGYDLGLDNQPLMAIFDGIIIGSHRFIDRRYKKANGSIKNCPTLPFWDRFIASFGYSAEVDMKIVKKKPTLDTSGRWWFRQIKGLVRTFCDGLGKENTDKLIELTAILDKEKDKPEIIRKDQQLRISSLRKRGIHALFTEDELQYIYNRFGIDFGQGYYEVAHKEDSMITNRKVLKSMIKKEDGLSGINKKRLCNEVNDPMVQNTYFHHYGNSPEYDKLLSSDGYFVLNWLEKHIPSAFEQVLRKVKGNEREIIRESFA